MDKLDRKLVANCPAPLPDPRYPKWEDTGGAKVIKGLNRRWEKILGWMPGEAGGQGGYFVDGHYAFKTTAPAKVVEKFAENFGEIPLDSAGVPFPPSPGDVLIRSLADLAKIVQKNAHALEYREDGEPDWAGFVDLLREGADDAPGHFPVNPKDVKRVTTAVTNQLAKQTLSVIAKPNNDGAEMGEAVRLLVTEPAKHADAEEEIAVPEGCTAARFLAGFLGSTDEQEGEWGPEQERQLQWVQSVAQQASKALGTLVRNKENKIMANRLNLEGSAKERRNNEKRNSRPRTEPAWPAGWGEREQELREQLGLNKHTNFDQNTEQEITAQMEELQQARSNSLWGCCRNIAAASNTVTVTPREGGATDRNEEERLDSALKEMFDADQTRMLLLYRLPPEAVVKQTRPDWTDRLTSQRRKSNPNPPLRIVRNTPEYHNMPRRRSKRSTLRNRGDSSQPRMQPPPRGTFNAEIEDYNDGPVSVPGRQVRNPLTFFCTRSACCRSSDDRLLLLLLQAAIIKDRDEEFEEAQQGLKKLKEDTAKSEEEWNDVQAMTRPQSSLDHLPAMSRRKDRKTLRAKSEASIGR